MTLIERDILAVLLALDVVFMILILPNVVPILFDFTTPLLYILTLAFGLPLGALGVWVNHHAVALQSKDIERRNDTPRRK